MQDERSSTINIKTGALITGGAILLIGALGYFIKEKISETDNKIKTQWSMHSATSDRIGKIERIICKVHPGDCP